MTIFPRVLKAVSLIGADVPGVKGLKPLDQFIALYDGADGVDISNVEIFSAGTHIDNKGRTHVFTEEDLDNVVASFGKVGFEPPLKLGHSPDQTILQSDGLPAAGFISGLVRKGKMLLAHFTGVPKKIAELISKGAYKFVSSEVLTQYVSRQEFSTVLFIGNDGSVTGGGTEPEGVDMSDAAAEKAKAENEALKKAIEDQNVKIAEFAASNEQLKTSNAELVAAVGAEKTARQNSEIASFIDSSVKSGHLAPAEREATRITMSALANSSETTKFTEGDVEIDLPALEAYKRVISARESKFTRPTGDAGATPSSGAKTDFEAAVAKKRENNAEFSATDAVVEVARENPALHEAYLAAVNPGVAIPARS